eukprot:SAG22_NODE_1355_length_4633_cov_5.252978_4_plen_123_part_00
MQQFVDKFRYRCVVCLSVCLSVRDNAPPWTPALPVSCRLTGVLPWQLPRGIERTHSAKRASMAQSRIKALEKMTKIAAVDRDPTVTLAVRSVDSVVCDGAPQLRTSHAVFRFCPGIPHIAAI